MTKRSTITKPRVNTVLLLIAIAAVMASFRPTPANVASSLRPGSWEVYFSPPGGCTAAVVDVIGHAKKTVFVQAYSFTSEPIAKALIGAHKRKVRVEVMLDSSQVSTKYSPADLFSHSGIITRIDAAHAIAHNKVMIIDGETVITGSFNFTRAAETKNAENLLVIRDKTLAAKYTKNWKAHQGHSDLHGG